MIEFVIGNVIGGKSTGISITTVIKWSKFWFNWFSSNYISYYKFNYENSLCVSNSPSRVDFFRKFWNFKIKFRFIWIDSLANGIMDKIVSISMYVIANYKSIIIATSIKTSKMKIYKLKICFSLFSLQLFLIIVMGKTFFNSLTN